MTLYELTGSWQAVLAAYDAAETDEERDEILSQMDALSEDIADKGGAYARIVRNAEAEAEAFGNEIKRLTAAKRNREALAARLKDRMLAAMQAVGADKMVTDIGTWKRRLNPYAVQVVDVEAVPERFLIPQAPTVDKRGILAEFKETGEILPGVEMVRSESVTFR